MKTMTMKDKNKYIGLLLCMFALAPWMLGACDDKLGGDTTTSIEFPTDTLNKVVSPGDTVAVEFNAATNWKVVSNRNWCVTADGYMDAAGKSGKHTVSFIINDKGHGFVEDMAEVTLWMGNENQVVANITRRAKGYFMELCNSDSSLYAVGESMTLGTSGVLELNVNTNIALDQLRLSTPAWIRPKRDGKAITLEVVKDSLRYSINHPTDSFTLFKSDNAFKQSYHVQYVGMDSRELRINPEIEGTLVVSRDAKQCHVGSTEYTAPITFTVEALNNGYELLSMTYDRDKGYAIIPANDCWFAVEDDHCGNISLAFAEENQGNERRACLLALPHAIVDSLAGCSEGYDVAVVDFLLEELDGRKEMKQDAQQFCLVEMMQEKSLDWTVTISPEARWNLRVSSDGTIYSDAIRGDTCDAPVKALVTGSYRLICASYNNTTGCAVMEMEDSWLEVTDNKLDSLEVRFKANDGNERILFLFALPLPLVESLDPESEAFHANLSGELFEEIEGLLQVKTSAEQYMIAKFTQEADEENSMRVFDKEFKGIEVVKETDQEWLDIAAAKGVAPNKVFRCSMELGFSYTINPLIPISVWDTGNEANNDRMEVYGKSGKKYVSGKDEDYKEDHVIMDEIEGSNYMLVTFTANYKNIKEDLIIYFVDNDTDYLKALVVTSL